MRQTNKLFLLLALLLTAATGAWAQGPWTSGDCTVTLTDDGVLIVSGTGAMADYTKVSEQPWTSYRSSITSIVVGEGVTHIGNFALMGCNKATSVSLSSSLTSIGTSAFRACNNAGFTSIAIPANVEIIGDNAFHTCNKLTQVNIPDKVTSIGQNAFYGCTAVTSITVGKSVTSIGEKAFQNCSAMTTLAVKAPACALGTYALDACSSLTTIYVTTDKADYYKTADGWSAYAAKIQAGYDISLKEGTEDAYKWAIMPGLAAEGDEVTIQYTGRLKVKGVKATVEAPAATPTLAEATAEDYGKVVCAAGHLHDAKTAVPDGCTAVGILGKVTATGHGLILALQNATSQNWNTINGWTSVTTYAGTTLKVLPDDAARGSLTSYTTLGSTAVSNWAVGQKGDYEAIFQNLGSTTEWDGWAYDGNVNAYITTGVGGTAMSGGYWSATESEMGAWGVYDDDDYYWGGGSDPSSSMKIRPVLGFGGEAAAAKPAATVTTAPTGAAIVGAGKTTALVSGGVAEGGTLMYAVTTENTKPTSTDGFSDAVPTAQSITASGKVYVWYYVKGDDTHSDSEIAATAIEVTVKALPITVTWNASDIVPENSWDNSFTKDGITITAATCNFEKPTFGGGGTFTNTLGNFTKIEISADYAGDVSGTGWSNDGWQSATWTGNAASVSFSGEIWGGGMTCDGGNLKIVFTIE